MNNKILFTLLPKDRERRVIIKESGFSCGDYCSPEYRGKILRNRSLPKWVGDALRKGKAVVVTGYDWSEDYVVFRGRVAEVTTAERREVCEVSGQLPHDLVESAGKVGKFEWYGRYSYADIYEDKLVEGRVVSSVRKKSVRDPKSVIFQASLNQVSEELLDPELCLRAGKKGTYKESKWSEKSVSVKTEIVKSQNSPFGVKVLRTVSYYESEYWRTIFIQFKIDKDESGNWVVVERNCDDTALCNRECISRSQYELPIEEVREGKSFSWTTSQRSGWSDDGMREDYSRSRYFVTFYSILLENGEVVDGKVEERESLD